VFVLQWPTAELNARIERRVDAMFAAGLVEEVRTLLNRPRPAAESARIRASFAGESANPEVWRLQLPLSRTAAQAAGYREVIEHLRGRRTLAETVQLVKTHTRQLAKRQRTWFRSLSECRFVPVHEPLNPAEVARQIAEEGSCGMMNTE
jgi:tRNA dimethylallyltransferase